MKRLILVRHGESTANVEATAAERSGAKRVDIEERDADVRLSDLGREQATALGEWLGSKVDASEVVIFASPCAWAVETISIALHAAGMATGMQLDERLRDRELGILDLLTSHGVRAQYPDDERRRSRLGKFYYRAPGGESWPDVTLRLRSALRDIEVRADRPGTLIVVTHDALVMLTLFVLLD